MNKSEDLNMIWTKYKDKSEIIDSWEDYNAIKDSYKN